MKSKKAFITGISGQDGAYLAQFLLSKGYKVYGGFRRNSQDSLFRLRYLGIEDKISIIDFDLSDPYKIYYLIKENRFDEIYNLAAQSFVQSSWEMPLYTTNVNSLGVLNLLDSIKKESPNTKFYQASTSEMFGKVEDKKQNEQSRFYPRSPYGISKLFSHWCVVNYRESFNLFCCSGILFNHESPLRGYEFVTKKISSQLAEIKLGIRDHLFLGNLYAKRDWGYAKEYVEAMWLMLQAEKPSDYVISTGVETTVKHFVEMCANSLNISIEWKNSGINECGIDKKSGKEIIFIDKNFFRPAEVDSLLGDSSKAHKELGWNYSTSIEKLASIMVEFDYNLQKKGLLKGF